MNECMINMQPCCVMCCYILGRFDPRLNGLEAERKFMWKSVTPYISFFIVLLITVAVFPLCDKHWIPCSELSLVALFFTGNHWQASSYTPL